MFDQTVQFEALLKAAGSRFSRLEIDLLSKYYGLVLKWNPRLHLTTLTRPEDFLHRHVEEVVFAEKLLLPGVTSLWDLGSGLGVPGIPMKILRPGLSVTLVEASRKKAIFLETVIDELDLTGIRVDGRRLETLDPLPPGSALMARAVERMESLLPEMLRLGANSTQKFFFCSRQTALTLPHAELYTLPGSLDRWLAIVPRGTI